MPHHGEGVGAPGHLHYARYIWCLLFGAEVVHPGEVLGRVYLTPFQVEFTQTIDILGLSVRAPAGSVRVGVYADNGDAPDGGAVVVESASVALGAGRGKHEIPVVAVQLDPGLYWHTLMINNTGISLMTTTADVGDLGTLFNRTYDQAYGALTDPCPVTVARSYSPIRFHRVASSP